MSLAAVPCWGAGYYHSWVPLQVKVTYRGAGELRGSVRVSFGQGAGNEGGSLDAPIAVASGTTRRLTLDLPPYLLETGFPEVMVWVADGGGSRISAAVPIAFQPASYAVPAAHVAVVRPGGLAWDEWQVLAGAQILQGMSSPSAPAVSVMRHPTTPDLMPDAWAGYIGLDAVILHQIVWSDLSPEQLRALREWVRTGGHLLLSPGNDPAWFKAPALAEFCPATRIEVEKDARLDRPPWLPKALDVPSGAFEAYRLEGAGAPLLRSGDLPLAYRRACGKGTVTMLAVDVSRRPFIGWTGTDALWVALMERLETTGPARGPYLDGLRGRYLRGSMWTASGGGTIVTSDVASSTVEDRFDASLREGLSTLPPFGLLVGLVAAYVLAVGPANHFLCRRRSRHLWLAATIPAVSLLFVGAVVAIGYWIRGTATATRTLGILETSFGESLAFEERFAVLLSAGRRDYTVGVEAGALLAPAQSQGVPVWNMRSMGGGVYIDDDGNVIRMSSSTRWKFPASSEAAHPLIVEQSNGMRLKGYPMDLWEAAGFGAQAVRDLGGGITFRLAEDGRGIRLTNGSRAGIRAGRFFWADPGKSGLWIGRVGPVGAGQTAVVALLEHLPRSVGEVGAALEAEAPFGRDAISAILESAWSRVERVSSDEAGGSFQRRAGLVAILDGFPVPLDAGQGARGEELAVLVIAP